MAQNLVVEGLVKHNGEVDLRKRAKIRRGDSVEVFDKKIIVE
jgi:ribosome-associated protein